MARTRPNGMRERIQAAALELFAVHGVQQTSLRAIAERLGITKPALYYHFGSREDLLRGLAQPLIGGIGDCFAMFSDRPVTELRPAVLDAACAALGIQANR